MRLKFWSVKQIILFESSELEQTVALKYLYGWLCHHPKYGTLAPPELADSVYYADVARLFNEVAQMSPEDADVHIVLGVLYNLSGEYDKATASFKTALKLKPNDYSLWNKPGATEANSVQSADAILAYQQALDLKPNYVRAWANIGISYANQGFRLWNDGRQSDPICKCTVSCFDCESL